MMGPRFGFSVFIVAIVACSPGVSSPDAGAGLADDGAVPPAASPDAATLEPVDAARYDAGDGVDGLAQEGWCLPETLLSCSGAPPLFENVLLEAERFGDGSTFVAMQYPALLVRRGEGIELIHLGAFPFSTDPLGEETGDDEFDIWSLPLRDWQVLDAAPLFRGRETFVLACETLGDEGLGRDCTVFHAQDADGELNELDGLPEGLEARGIVADTQWPHSVCVYGNGLACWSNGWEVSAPFEPGVDLRSVLLEPEPFAVGASGRRWEGERSDDGTFRWRELHSLGSEVLRSVSGFDPRLAHHADGYYVFAEGDELHCASTGIFDARIVGRTGRLVLKANGQVWSYLHSSEGATSDGDPGYWCQREQVETGALLGLRIVECNATSNPWILTPTRLLGRAECWTIR